MGETLETISRAKDSFSKVSVTQAIIARINNWDYIKSKIFCTTKETTNSEGATYRMEKNLFQPLFWQRINI